MTDDFGARCLFCNKSSRTSNQLGFVCSKHKIGRVKDRWGICHRCLAKAMAQFCEDLEMAEPK